VTPPFQNDTHSLVSHVGGYVIILLPIFTSI
jgi:hypothetical protein